MADKNIIMSKSQLKQVFQEGDEENNVQALRKKC